MGVTLEELLMWVAKEKPKYIIARSVGKEAMEYVGAETEAEALKVRTALKAKGGRVTVFQGGEPSKLSN